MFRKSSIQGMYLIEILIVVVVLLILSMGYFNRNQAGVSTYTMSIDKTKSVDCDMNRHVIESYATTWAINHPGQTPTIEALEKAGHTIPKCRQQGVYSFGSNGEVYCSVHSPAPTPPPTPYAVDLLK